MKINFFSRVLEVPKDITEVTIYRDETDLGTEMIKIDFKRGSVYVTDKEVREWWVRV